MIYRRFYRGQKLVTRYKLAVMVSVRQYVTIFLNYW